MQELTIKYIGNIDASEISITSDIGASNIQPGDSIKITNSSSIYIDRVEICEQKIDKGLLKWETKATLSRLAYGDGTYYIVGDSYIPNSNNFFRIITKLNTTYKLGDIYELEITANEKIAKSFLTISSTITSRAITRECNQLSLKDNIIGKTLRHPKEDNAAYFVSPSNLRWYLTSDSNFLITNITIRNLSSEKSLVFQYSIQGMVETLVTNSDGSKTYKNQWLTPSNNSDGTGNGLKMITVTLPPNETKVLEFYVRTNSTNPQSPIAKFDTLDRNGNKQIKTLNFTDLFWRFNMNFGKIYGTNSLIFEFYNEKMSGGANLVEKMNLTSYNQILINQKTL